MKNRRKIKNRKNIKKGGNKNTNYLKGFFEFAIQGYIPCNDS